VLLYPVAAGTGYGKEGGGGGEVELSFEKRTTIEA